MTDEGGKRCAHCKTTKPFSEYYKYKRSDDGYHYNCKECCKMQRAKGRVKRRDKRSRVSNRQNYRARTEGADVEGGITIAALYDRDDGRCGICNGRVGSHEASIDHIEPITRGGSHTWDNVQLTHHKCNLRKGSS